MRTWTEELFGTKKAIIGLVHMQPLPGDPDYDPALGMDMIIEKAKEDVEALQDGGIDGLLFSNEFSIPYQTKVSNETVAAMAYVMGVLKPYIKVPYGNDVISDELASISLSAATGARFTRGVFHGAWATSSGICNTDGGAAAARLKHNLGIDGFKQVFYLIPESSGDLGGRDAFTILKPNYFLKKPDGLAIAGMAAGQKADAGTVRKCREAFPDAVIFASTGVNIDNIEDYMDVVDGAFIGTHFKKDGQFRNQIDVQRVKAFMDKVRELRKDME